MLERANFRLARRRRITLLGVVTVATVFAAGGMIDARQAAGGQLFGHVVLTVWATTLVIGTFAGAVKPKPVRAGALAAVLLGPLLMPVLFGPGGWRGWQIAAVLLAAVAALLPPRSLMR